MGAYVGHDFCAGIDFGFEFLFDPEIELLASAIAMS